MNVSFAPWRYAAVLAVMFLAAHLGLKTWQYFHYKKVESQLDAQIAEMFQQLCPARRCRDARKRAGRSSRCLNQLRGTGPASGMMTTLAMLGEAMARRPTPTSKRSPIATTSPTCACSRRPSMRSIASARSPASTA